MVRQDKRFLGAESMIMMRDLSDLEREETRPTAAHVQILEKNFEVENQLEPEGMMQLAIELGLQPRQVAIWFRNRRARFKHKQEDDLAGV
ncbi:hypothetical protein SADUNF_Sadunf10G0031200 [Salix dunnii]|uniref:Homeobox-leucine zipper protein n=1 Tax=Salix dunnii TaxID=1413687 RepID=A0A835MQ05_9ROSI|nr:hypothetical protein SADUNF_Sadunf10G0031200 [Salix dunnii]